MSTNPRPTDTGVPDRLISGCQPELVPPATIATLAMVSSASTVYVTATSALPMKIWPRSTERVRTVLSVPFWSSDATMSPATSAVMSGNNQYDPNVSSTSGTASPD